ncbi:hypothetical protein [Nocardia brevicatena]|uniref:hypothetical protein n=1 Tax=Nocardia brevicatena TaxID=37327 RepID=UPI0002E72472|nr:hypothetical protein [Nocardia brevicatena]
MNRGDEQSRQDCELPAEPIGLAQARRLLDLHEGHNCPHLHSVLTHITAVM